MSDSSKKMAVLSVVQQQNSAITLKQILEILGSGYSERTVRRWLTEFTSRELLKKIGEKRSTRYIAVLTPKLTSNIFTPSSLNIIQQIQQPLYVRKPISYQTKWLQQYIPNRTFYLPNIMQQQLLQAGKRSSNHQAAGTYARHIFNKLLIDLSYNSARLEGNTYSLLETQRLLIEGKEATGKLDVEKIMILNHKEAIRYIVDNIHKIKINSSYICTIQFLLSEGLVPNEYAGKVRDHGVRISSSTYIPFENFGKLTTQLQYICNKALKITNPFEQSFFLLVHIAYLQAFIDVNKRTARLSANIPLIQNNLVPFSFNDMDKEDYTNAMLAIYELNDIQPLLELYYYSYLRTCEQYDATVEASSFDEIRVLYRQARRQIIRFIITKQLKGPVLDQYIETHIPHTVSKNHRTDFIEDIKEDLQLISPERIAGLGITKKQLELWLKKSPSLRTSSSAKAEDPD